MSSQPPNDSALSLVIDEAGRILVEGRAALRRLAARPGRYRLLPSPANLVILERAEDGGHVEGRTVMSGDIERLGGLIDVLHFIYSSNWSGQLTIIDRSVRKSLYFKRGDVRTASSNVAEDRIGSILYRYGLITVADLEEALTQVTQEHRFGQVLVDKGKLSQHDLYQYVRKQVEEIFYSVLVLRRGEYYFYRTSEEEVPPSQIQLSTKQLLFEGVRRIDEMSYFREKIPSSDVVLMAREPPPGDKLPPREARVLSLIDGVRDLATIARESHLGEFEATKVCFQLLHSEWVTVRPRAPSSLGSIPTVPSEDTLRYVVESYNQAFERIFAIVETQKKQNALLRGLESFFVSTAEFAPLFVGISVDERGRVKPETLLGNLALAPAPNRDEYLRRGLRELLFYELFTAGEAVDRAEETAIHAKLQQILREMPEPADPPPPMHRSGG